MAYGSNRLQNIYFALPSTAKDIFASVYGIKQRKERYGRTYYSHLEFLRLSQFWDHKKVREYQEKMLVEFVNKSLYFNRYYKTNYDTIPIGGIHDLSILPILQKSTVRTYRKDIINTDNIPCKWSHTSGTTGSALIFPISLNAFQKEYAFRALHYEWSGVGLHTRDPIAICAGHPVAHPSKNTPPFWVHDWANNWIFFSSYHMTESNLRYYVKELENFDPVMIHGYPSSMYLLSKAFKKFGSRLSRLRSVYTSSETLMDFQRTAIEESFQVKVFNWYGTSEMTTNIVECEMGELHLKPEHSFTEILNNRNELCMPGETGRIVATNFSNDAFPLIRYDIGDEVVIAKNQTSKCGRCGTLIEKVSGRKEDYIITPDGRIIGRLDHLFKDSLNVIEAQIEQNQPESVILRIVKNELYNKKDEANIMEEAVLRMGASIKIEFDYVTEIPRTKNGKFRFILSTMNKGNIEKNESK